ncbi:MAG: ATP-binding cassette domain-containing protein [Eubacterium sp.]|nr:ATP-binding cassette domain-containing protein [Eubacterium sp.]
MRTTQAASTAEPELKTYSDLDGKTVGMLTGAPFEEMVREKSDVKDVLYFSSMADMSLALQSGKLDAYLMNNAVGTLDVNRDSSIALFPEKLQEAPFGLAFKKGSDTYTTWQKAFDTIDPADLDAAWEKWTSADESIKILPEQDWPGSNGEVNVAACDTLPPMSYVGNDGELLGFDVEVILMIAEKLDVHVNFTGMEFSPIMTEVQTGKSDIGCGSILVTDERRELVDFIEHYPGYFCLVVRSTGNAEESGGFFSELGDSFERTFIRDGRWKMVASGLGLTVLMSILAGGAGLLLGFALLFLHRKNIRIINAIIHIINSLIAGIPVVVILMVFYYIIFGSISMPAVIVASVGFAIVFGSRVFGTLHSAVASVDPGQQEAAYALGYQDSMAFRRIILPQAKPVYTPLLQAQFVTLVKETSVAGFITVLDLTRAGDLIRSRTMEAFFPLISIAVIYFCLTKIFTLILRRLVRLSQKKHGTRHLSGLSGDNLSATEGSTFSEKTGSGDQAGRVAGQSPKAQKKALIKINNLVKAYTGSTPLNHLDLEVNSGEVISIIGPSGTGKSTLLRCINRLETPTDGTIIFEDINLCDQKTDLAQIRRRMGMVFQSFNLFGHKTVIENIMMPQMDLLGISEDDAYREAIRQLDRVGLVTAADQYPDELSGGQKQRVAIARALAMHPEVLLFDEPTSALDPTMVSEVLSVIRGLAGTGLTMLIVTHEMRLARDVSDRVIFLSGGTICEQGTAGDIFEHPEKPETIDFIYRMKSYNYDITSDHPDMFKLFAEVEEFCHRQFMDSEKANDTRLVIEEAVTGVLVPLMRSYPDTTIRLCLESGEGGAKRKLTIDHSGLPAGTDPFAVASTNGGNESAEKAGNDTPAGASMTEDDGNPAKSETDNPVSRVFQQPDVDELSLSILKSRVHLITSDETGVTILQLAE